MCVCVWQRAAKQDGYTRLVLAETLRGTDRVVGADERRGMKEWSHQHWRLPIFSFLLLCCRWAPGRPRQSEVQHRRKGSLMERCRCRGGDETTLLGSLCWRITRGRKRISALFSSSCLTLSEWSTWPLKDTQHLPAWICWIITWMTPGQVPVIYDLQVSGFFLGG